MKFDELPLDIILAEIGSYLTNFDRALLSVSSSNIYRVFHQILRYTIPSNQTEIIQRLNHGIVCVKVTTSLDDLHILNGVNRVEFLMVDIREVRPIHSATSLNFYWCSKLVDIGYLRNVEELVIHNCCEIVNFSPLLELGPNLKRLKLIHTSIETLDVLPLSLQDLHLNYCTKLQNIDRLKELGPNLLTFNLYNCNNINNLEPIRYVSSSSVVIDLRIIHNLYDISFIPSTVSKLSISSCSNLEPILPSNLGLIPVLILEECYSIIDISALGFGNVDVTISHCPQIYDITSLRRVPRIHLNGIPPGLNVLSGGNGVEIEIRNMKNLNLLALSSSFVDVNLINCSCIISSIDTLLHDSPTLRSLQALNCCINIGESYKVKSLCARRDQNGVVQSLDIITCMNTMNIFSGIFGTYYNVIHRLDLSSLSRYSCAFVQKMVSLTELDLSKNTKIQNVRPLRSLLNLRVLNLSQCSRLIDVSALSSLTMNLRIVNLSNCCQLTDINCLSNVHKLSVAYCSSVQDVSGLFNVSDLNLSFCDKITDVTMLHSVHKLNLLGCNRNLVLPNHCKCLITPEGKKITKYL